MNDNEIIEERTMALLAVQTQGCKICLRGGAITILSGGKPVRTVPMHRITEVHLYGGVSMTPPARNKLLAEGIDVLLLSQRGSYRGRMTSVRSSASDRRLMQYRALLDDGRKLDIARGCVEGKLWNQGRVLHSLSRKGADADLAAGLGSLRRLRERVERAEDLDELRGIEGQAAVMYFRALGAAISNPEFSFTGRNRRPPKDPVNSCLSFGYTILLRRVEAVVQRAGMDVYLGALHAPRSGKPSLALDLMEEFRPILVDRVVLRLINRRQLSPDDFEEPGVDITTVSLDDEEDPEAERAVYLADSGRTVFLKELNGEWRRTHRVSELEKVYPFKRIVEMQAQRYRRALEGEVGAYESFKLG